jgi:hypothetical protein
MVPSSPEERKGMYQSQHYSQDADGASSEKDASSDTEGWRLQATHLYCVFSQYNQQIIRLYNECCVDRLFAGFVDGW